MNIRLTLFLIASLLLMLACQRQKQSSFVQKPVFIQDTIFYATMQAKTDVLKDSTVSRNYEYVIKKGEQLLIQYKDSLSYDSIGWAMLHHRLGVAYSRVTPQDSIFYKKMRVHFNTAIALRKAILTEKKELANSYLNLSIGENEYGEYKAAIITLENAFDSFSEKDTLRYISVRRQLLLAYTKLGEKDLVEKYFKSIEYYYSPIVTEDKVVHREYAGSLHYYARFLCEKENYKDAIKYYILARQLFKKIDEKGAEAAVNLELSHALMQDKQNAAAISTVNSTIPYFLKQKDTVNLGQAYFQLANCYIAQKNYVQALAISEQKALPILQNQQNKIVLGKCYQNITVAYSGQGNYQKALENSQKSLKSYLFDFKNEDITQNPSEKQLRKCQVKSDLIDVLGQKAEDFSKLGTQKKSTVYLENALETYQTLNTVLALIREDILSENSKIDLGERQDWINDALRVAKQLYAQTNDVKYAEQAYALVQNSKAQVINEHLQGEKGKEIANISKADKDTLRVLYAKCSKLYKQQSDKPDDKVIADKTLIAETKFYDFQKQIEKKYPVYYDIKYNHEALEIKEIQARMKEKKAILDYMDTKDSLHIFCITKQRFTWKTIAVSERQKADANTLRTILSDSSTIKSPKSKQFLECSNRLYQLLVQPMSYELSGITGLQFIPSGWVHKVAFNSLCTSPYLGNWSDKGVPFLVRKYASSYLFSVKDLQPIATKKNSNKISVGSFGITYNDKTFSSLRSADSCLSNLANTRGGGKLLHATEEANQVYATWGIGDCLLNGKATKNNFIKNCQSNNYSILHLAMHSVSECNDPQKIQLIFAKSRADEDNLMHLNEIAGMKMHSDLAVLSACHSGDGKLENHEGIISLGRAFAMAGCKSLITSNSYVIDNASPEIFKNFYDNLKDNEDKDVALQQATIKYLNGKTDADRIPYRWANFKLWGNTDKVQGKESPQNNLWWIALGFAVIGLFSLFFLNRKKS